MNSVRYMSFFLVVFGCCGIQAADDVALDLLNRGVAIARGLRGVKKDEKLRIVLQKKQAELKRKEEKQAKKRAKAEYARKMAILRKMR